MIDAMKKALEALEGWDNYGYWVWPETALEQCKRNTKESLSALRQAIAEAEKQEHFDGRILVRLRQAAWKKVGQEFKDDPECCFALGFDAGIDAVAPRVEPAVSQSGGGFESLPASPQAEKEATLQEISDIGREIEQEPVARFNWNEAKFEWLTEYSYEKHHMKPLYLAPLKREWVGLTMQDIDDVTGDVGFGYIDVSFAIEAKLKEKNT